MKKPVLISAILVAAALPPFLCNGESRSIEESDRISQGTFLRLADGMTHYQALGRREAAPVVFVHGFSASMFMFDHLMARFNGRYYAVRYDLFGRGLSDRPRTDYNQDLFDRQLLGLLDELGLQKVMLTGTSMGGLIAAEFAARHPERVSHLALIAPAGFLEKVPFSARLARAPILGDYIVYSFGDSIFVRNNRANFYGAVPEGFYEKFGKQTVYRGFKRALISTLRHMPLEGGQAAFERAGKTALPKLLIWGKNDAVVPFANAASVASMLPGVQTAYLDGAGHCPHYEMPNRVAPLLEAFFSGKPLPALTSP